ncbi:hypothetical protein ABN028_19745 [Actinopolymorpha sp. B17G11]|uniref:hypothetical protein n=1 Tax=Actinopolymorpha sp. B17G11 TaxID=3160861 RepID=UPI0032E50B53
MTAASLPEAPDVGRALAALYDLADVLRARRPSVTAVRFGTSYVPISDLDEAAVMFAAFGFRPAPVTVHVTDEDTMRAAAAAVGAAVLPHFAVAAPAGIPILIQCVTNPPPKDVSQGRNTAPTTQWILRAVPTSSERGPARTTTPDGDDR